MFGTQKKGQVLRWYMMKTLSNLLTDEELFIAGTFLKKLKHVRLYIRDEHPRGFKVLNHV